MTIIWKDYYKVGDDTIDSHHEELFALMDKFVSAKTKEEFTNCTMDLYKYTRAHFAYEEKVMKEIRYPASDLHIKQHTELITHLNHMAEAIASDTVLTKGVEDFMKHWLLDHIRLYDTKLSKYIKLKSN